VNQTAINWIRNGHLKAFMTPGGQYRVYIEDLMAFLESRGMKVPPELQQEDLTDWSSIIIVDDDRDLNDVVAKLFKKRMPELSIHQAFDGFEAGRLISAHRPGFVILDIDLPGVDGRELCKRIKLDPAFGKPFIIAVTGLDEGSTKDAIINAGADAFFPKPLELDKLVDAVRALKERLNG
jgi:excisionase family DNA binding protein